MARFLLCRKRSMMYALKRDDIMNKIINKKTLLILLILLLMASFFYFDLQQLITLENLKTSVTQIHAQIDESPLYIMTLFFLLYVFVTALSLPGAAILTLASGALFGLLKGLILVSFASSIGATLAFLVSRYLLRDFIKAKFPERLSTIDTGIKKQGAFYLFTLRLVPIFPFFLINLLMGITAIKTRTYYLVSQMGMLAGTIVYVNAGTQLAHIENLSGILSIKLIFAFALLGVFPLISQKILAIFKQYQVYKNFNKPKHFDRNIIVIGAGAGGLVTSYIAAAVKAKVTLIEASEMGGDCLNFGCVPSKAIIKSAKMAHQMAHAEQYGLENITPQFSFNKIMLRVHNVITQIRPHDSVERYTKLGVEVIKGYATLLDPWRVAIKHEDGHTQVLSARTIVLATGASPFIPPIEGLENAEYVTSDTIWTKFATLEKAPKKLVVMGGGPIGCELSQAFSQLGVEVTQIEKNQRLMSREDPDVSDFVQQALHHSGVNILAGYQVIRCERDQNLPQKKYIIVKANNTNDEIRIEYDELLCAVGRRARLKGFGLETLGIDTNQTLETNEYLQTIYPNIYAVGDVVGHYQFTHVAAHHGWYAAVNGLFDTFKKFKVDYRVIPWTTFITPEVARVGINEQEAIEQGIEYEITRFDFNALDRAITESATAGFIKVLTPKGKDHILGVTIIGEHAGDTISEFVLAMKYKLGLNKILSTIHSYPTWSESNKYAAGEWKRNHTPQKLLNWVEKYHTWRRK